MDLTYNQVATLIRDLYGLGVDRGDIAGILAASAKGYLPEYERLKAAIRSGPGAHMDETSWKIQSEGMTGGERNVGTKGEEHSRSEKGQQGSDASGERH